ncbi:MAG: DNA mismatch repair endonuclease MutL [Paludibacteraceae bacterium]|nr:DNA mismatch repair endonuclease MutL [Paludibacteraceae bacterium]
MSENIIHILPEVVSNQIAAGEVVQRPSSVVKELVENSIDAGATKIDIYIKEAGRTSIRIIDNGKGMSADDAVMAFQPHATSKIADVNDLFSLSTMGFRGEALASISAVAFVEVRTKREEDTLGTRVEYTAADLVCQECIQCPKGTDITVRDIFYNVPARRKFLKPNDTEFRHIVSVFEQITLAHQQISFTLVHNDKTVFNLPKENRLQRICSLFGTKWNQKLLPISIETTLGKISGYIGTPEAAMKRNCPQFFFVNNRYIQHPYFHKAISMSYDKLLMPDVKPAYFVFFEMEADKIDVNIHPTKTEVKFEDEKSIFPILSATVKEALGKSNSVPSIDFDQDDAPEIPAFTGKQMEYVAPPKVSYNPNYNPFNTHSERTYTSNKPTQNWESLYAVTKEVKQVNESKMESAWANLEIVEDFSAVPMIQTENKYIVFPVSGGIKVVDQYRASLQINYEQTLKELELLEVHSSPLLFPEAVELDVKEDLIFNEIKEELEEVGFTFTTFGKQTYQITAVPNSMINISAEALLEEFISMCVDEKDVKTEIKKNLAIKIAEKNATKGGVILNEAQMRSIIERLSKCESQVYTTQGKKISVIINNNEIENKFL